MTDEDLTTILKRDAMGRVTITREQREALLDEFERSGLKGMPFARMVGVAYPTFARGQSAYWNILVSSNLNT